LSETKDNSRDIKDGKKFSSAEVEKKRHNLESHNKSKDSKKVKLDDMVTKDLSAAPKLKDSEKLRNIESSRYEEVKSVIVVGSQKITKPVKSTDLRR